MMGGGRHAFFHGVFDFGSWRKVFEGDCWPDAGVWGAVSWGAGSDDCGVGDGAAAEDAVYDIFGCVPPAHSVKRVREWFG